MENSKGHCEQCGRRIFLPSMHKGQKLCALCCQKSKKEEAEGKRQIVLEKKALEKPKTIEIKETKASCQACGHVWFYNKSDQWNNFSQKMDNTSDDLLKTSCCCLFFPFGFLAFLLPKKKVEDLNRCPKCGSRAIKKEIVAHNV